MDFLRETGARQEEGRALLTLGRILHAAGDVTGARCHWLEAARLLRECGGFDAEIAVRLLGSPRATALV
ncbi:hypothetical protein [Allorhizocola rhizosphaerae]|uniref:hypothetical protein n=1 Tax=Allorhizocola rhizosphaerae TaxID=1872709 RepID=UPI000E3B6E7B|nr:hypothetical protein [Allorhizocola rhizosphaerae]